MVQTCAEICDQLWWQDQVLTLLLKAEINLWSIILNCLWYTYSGQNKIYSNKNSIHTPPSEVLVKPLIKSFLLCHIH